MLLYAIQRIALSVLIIYTSMVMLFTALKLIPGDPATIMLGSRASAEMRARITQELGLDQPVYMQLATFFGRLFQGNLGTDMWSQRPVATMVMESLPYTLSLIVAGLGWAALIGIPLGCYSAVRRNSFLDKLSGVLSVATISIPSFVVAIYAILFFAIKLDWFPIIGAGERGDLGDQLAHLVLPAFALGLGWVGYLSRIVRASMLEVMGENHVRTAGVQDHPGLRAAARHPAHHHAAGGGDRRPAVGRGAGGGDLRAPRHRQAHRRCRQHAQLPGGAGRGADHGGAVCAHHAARRSPRGLARPPCPRNPLTPPRRCARPPAACSGGG
jgi:peptide/nickel transport system permease protein